MTPNNTPLEWDCWTTLGLSPRCRPATAKRVYKTLVKLHHPDVGGSVAYFKALQAAWSDVKRHFDKKGIRL